MASCPRPSALRIKPSRSTRASIGAWTLAARLRESAGSLADAAEALHRLAEIDRRNRIEHLTAIARLESRLGHIEPALKAGRDLLAAAPGNPENYEFFAQLCFGLGRPEEGLDALRRAVPPTRPRAASSSGSPRPWPASIKPKKPSRCTGVPSTAPTTSITSSKSSASSPSFTCSASQLDRLFAAPGASRPRRSPPGRRSTPPRRGHVHRARPTPPRATWEAPRRLEKLLATDTRDTRLLQQLAKLTEEEGDLETAARYQKMTEELAPSDEGQARLANLLAKSGDLEEAQAVWSRAAAGKSQSFRVFHAMDNLLLNGKPLPVLELTEASCTHDPKDWEALYRQGLALEALGRPKEAAARFEKLIDLPVADDEKSACQGQAPTRTCSAPGHLRGARRPCGTRRCRSRLA